MQKGSVLPWVAENRAEALSGFFTRVCRNPRNGNSNVMVDFKELLLRPGELRRRLSQGAQNLQEEKGEKLALTAKRDSRSQGETRKKPTLPCTQRRRLVWCLGQIDKDRRKRLTTWVFERSPTQHMPCVTA